MNNQEELLKKCLEFYSNEENYKNGMIQKDGGSYANQILDIYKTVKQNIQEQSDLFDSIKNDEESLDKYIKGISDLL